MPIKQVMCKICNTIVNKAVTYSVGKDERACKKHEGVVEKRGELELARFQKTQATIKAYKRKQERMSDGGSSTWAPPSLTPKCWLCMNEGLRSDEFFTRVLIEREKMKLLHGDFNPFDMTHPGNQIKVGRCIFVISKDKVTPEVMKFVCEDFESLVQMSGVLAICGQCCGHLKVNPIPTPKYKDLVQYTMLYEVVKPVVQAIAHEELNKPKEATC